MNRIKQIAGGDMQALEALYEAYKIPVYRLAFSLTKNREAAEDITQDTFLRIQEKAGTYRFHPSEAAWIYSIARNLSYDMLRRRRPGLVEDESLLLQIPAKEGNPEQGAYAFVDLISGLSVRDAEVVSLRILADLSFKEIGRITHTTASACGKRYGRALQKLQKQMKENQ